MPPSGFLNLTARSDRVVRLDPLRGRAAPDRRPWVIRPEDLLVLDVERVNLKVVPGERGAPAQLVRERGGLAYLIVTFPPQHVAESAYYESEPGEPGFGPSLDPPPIPAVIAGWSRLVFRVTDERLPIPWTLEGVLRAMTDLELSLPANAAHSPQPPVMAGSLGSLVERANRVGTSQLAPLAAGSAVSAARARRQLRQSARSLGLTERTGRATAQLHRSLAVVEAGGIPPFLARPGPQPPTLAETAIELPHEMFLAPDPSARWSHAVAPAKSSETGHTELWHTRLDTGAGGHGLRAVWTTAQDPPPSPDPALPQLQSLLPRHKRNIVDLTSNYGLPSARDPRRFYEPRPVRADLLMLSSLGAWLDARGVWDEHPLGVDVEEWRHRATLGRDHYVRIVEAGYLLPWGHRASLITVTERRFHSDRAGNPAYLRQRKFIIVREPLKAYRDSGHTYQGADALRHGERLDLMLPFERVQVVTLVTPALDRSADDDVGGQGDQCFWPRVGGQLLKFHLKASDVLGNEIELAMPLVFVMRSLVEAAGSFLDEAAAAYGAALSPGSSTLRATVAAGGARVAFAESAGPDDTTFPAQSLTFGAEVSRLGPAQGVEALVPPFLPVLRGAAIDIPSLQGIARTARPVSLSFASAYLRDAFGGPNAGQVFLAADPAAPAFDVPFSGQADRTGALVTPDLRLSGVSRITGPVAGSLVHAAHGSFKPMEWFKDFMSASLFGVLRLTEIVEVAGFDELDKLPRFAGQILDPVESLLEQLERLRERLATDSAPDTTAAAALVHGLIDPGTGSIPALLSDGSVATVVARLASLDAELARLSGQAVGSPPTGVRAALLQVAGTVRGEIGRVLAEGDGLLQRFAEAGALPRAVQSRLDWRPQLKDGSTFKPRGDRRNLRNLTLSVEASGDAFTSTCSLVDFDLDLEFLVLGFEHVHFRAQAGRQAEVDVALDNIAFAGPLSFVETLRDLIPLKGFSDETGVTVTPAGITAAFSAGLPNIAVGVFSLENLSLAAGFTLPFAGPPMSVWFRFCERENPARLTVGLFGGGFFVGLTANAKGLAVVEGAIEFGAAAAVDLGVVAGSMSMMAGLYFKIQDGNVTLAGYFRMRGMVKAFGIVSVTIEMYLEMRFELGSGKCTGTATIEVEVDVTLFSVSASVTCTKKFAGSGNADPTLAQMLDVATDATSADWNQYCAAFA